MQGTRGINVSEVGLVKAMVVRMVITAIAILNSVLNALSHPLKAALNHHRGMAMIPITTGTIPGQPKIMKMEGAETMRNGKGEVLILGLSPQ